jgi:hypothetical protein
MMKFMLAGYWDSRPDSWKNVPAMRNNFLRALQKPTRC